MAQYLCTNVLYLLPKWVTVQWLLQAPKRGPTLKLGTNETSTNTILQANNYFAEQLALLTRILFLRSKT